MFVLAFVVAFPLLTLYGALFVVNAIGFDVHRSLGGPRLYGELYVEPWAAAAFAVTFLGCAGYGYRLRVRAVMDAVEPTRVTREDRPTLVDRVTALASDVGVDAPAVATIDVDTATAFTVGADPRTQTLVVSEDLLAVLDDDELDAVLAHELAHQRNADHPATAATVAVLSVLRPLAVPAVAGRTAELMIGFGVSEHPVVRRAVTIVYLPVALCFLPAFLGVRTVFYRSFSRYREYVADTAAGAIVDDYAALADALETLDEADGDGDSHPFLDAFTVVPVADGDERDAPFLESLGAVSSEDAQAGIRLGLQPPTSERVARIRALEGAR
ncbi:M48 family metallopeptidase [Halorubellus litoreus]|uniref:M48 family metallopeptidase n=1 Tax=Halorubellus litoreus TaxID=755308 RepID=A0ABD5VP02_9EURY